MVWYCMAGRLLGYSLIYVWPLTPITPQEMFVDGGADFSLNRGLALGGLPIVENSSFLQHYNFIMMFFPFIFFFFLFI